MIDFEISYVTNITGGRDNIGGMFCKNLFLAFRDIEHTPKWLSFFNTETSDFAADKMSARKFSLFLLASHQDFSLRNPRSRCPI